MLLRCAEAWKEQVVMQNGNFDDYPAPTFAQAGWYAGWFTPPGATIEQSRLALRTYRQIFDSSKRDQPLPWRWRMRQSRTTGLPAYLRGWVDQPPIGSDKARAAAERWLDDPLIELSLFGDLNWRRRFSQEPAVVSVPPPAPIWQRRFRAKAPNQPSASPDLNPQLAVVPGRRSTHVHLHYQQWHNDLPVLGGHLSVHLAESDWRISASSAYLPLDPARLFDPQFSPEDALDMARVRLMEYLITGGAAASDIGALAAWPTQIVSHGKLPLAVVPIAGDYHLCYEFQISSPDLLNTWSIFVDVENGKVLADPVELTYHAFAFAGSAEALSAAQSGGAVIPSLQQQLAGQNPCAQWMDILIEEQGGTRVPDWNTAQQSGIEFAATNAAIHAARTHQYLSITCNAKDRLIPPALPALPPEKRLTMLIGVKGNGKSATMFSPSQRLITLQDDDVVLSDGKIIHALGLDPEIVYHETMHGLTWLLNQEPFTNQIGTAPFAQALAEGYATYFACSLSEVQIGNLAAGAQSLFARAAYRQATWADRWMFSRGTRQPGQDYLPMPNLYPSNAAAGGALDDMLKYDVGMIWARTLWNLRSIIGHAQVDPLALEVFENYARGWVTSFETLAEGLIELAERRLLGWEDALLPMFGLRGIVAQQGIQALVTLNQWVVVGSDAGVQRGNEAVGWDAWGQLANGTELEGVIDLAVHGATLTVYAATETGIYHRAENVPFWKPFGAWPSDIRPLALTVADNGDLYVGGGDSIRIGRAGDVATTWSEMFPFEGLPLGLCVAQLTTPVLCVAGFNSVQTRLLTNVGNPQWRMKEMLNENSDMVACVAATANELFVGTGSAGIWRGVLDANARLNKGQGPIATPAALNQSAVLALAVDQGTVYAGTTGGVFSGVLNPNNQWDWNAVNGLPQGCVVTTLTTTATSVFAGTALHGLWRCDKQTQQWTSVPQIPSVADAVLPKVDNAAALMLPAVAAAGAEVSFHPFCLLQLGPIQIALNPPRSIEVWQLEPDAQWIAAAENGMVQIADQPPGFYVIVLGR